MEHKKLNILELFSGSRSFGIEAEKRGHNVFSIDIKDFKGTSLVIDIEFLKINNIPFIPDIIWASPPCTTYSIAAIFRHRDNGTPKTYFAEKSDRLVKNTLSIIKHFDCLFYLENPRGYLRKMPFMKGLNRVTVWYCQYGENTAKPTDIWSNNIRDIFNPFGWQPKKECFNGNRGCHHDKQPRGYKAKKDAGVLNKGTQGKKNNYERSKIPKELCIEILISSEIKLTHKKK